VTDEQLRQIISELTTSNISHIQATLLRQVIDLVSYSPQPQPPVVAEKKQVVKTSGVPWLNAELQILLDRFEEWYSATPKKRKAICIELGKYFLRTPGAIKSQFGKIRTQVKND
jgi:hypothetical protein